MRCWAREFCDGLFAGQLACAIDVERRGRVVFGPGPGLAAVEDVVGGVVDEERVALDGLFGEDAGREGVDGVGESHLGLGAIDGGVGGGVENQSGAARRTRARV